MKNILFIVMFMPIVAFAESCSNEDMDVALRSHNMTSKQKTAYVKDCLKSVSMEYNTIRMKHQKEHCLVEAESKNIEAEKRELFVKNCMVR